MGFSRLIVLAFFQVKFLLQNQNFLFCFLGLNEKQISPMFYLLIDFIFKTLRDVQKKADEAESFRVSFSPSHTGSCINI